MRIQRKTQKLVLGACAFLTIGLGTYDSRPQDFATPGVESRMAPRFVTTRKLTRTANPVDRWASFSNSILSPFAAGDLDTSFAGTGKVTTPFGREEDVATSVVLQPDGKIVCSGYSSSVLGTVAFVARYNADGSLDTAFGTGGKVTENFGGSFALATAIALQADGKIVAAGYVGTPAPATSRFDFFLLRYNPDGTLDLTFDADGKVTTDFSTFDEADSLLIQSDSKLVVTGSTSNNSPDRTFAALARYNADGSLDTSFGTGGKITGHEGSAFAAIVQPDGFIVTGGWGCTAATCTQNFDFTFARYNTNGVLDSTFGINGKATAAVSAGRDEGRAIARQSDGKIVGAGVNLNSSAVDPVAVVRLNANGTLDTGFGTGGIVQNLPFVVEDAFSLGLESSGKIVTGGRIFNTATDADFAVIRLNTIGTLDTTFGNGGIVTTSFGSNLDGITRFAIQSDGKIVGVGFAETQAGNIDAAIARYLTSVSVSGRITSPTGGGLRNVTVVITDSLGVSQFATTSSFGFYSFDNIKPGDTYRISVNSRLYRFAVQTLTINDNLTNVDFVGLE